MDDTEASSWKTTKGSKAVHQAGQGGDGHTVQVSAYTNSRFEGLKSFTLQTSTDGVNWKTQSVGGTNAFGYQAPRPVAPGPALQDVQAAHADQGRASSASGRTSRRATRRRTSRSATSRCSAARSSGLTPPPPPPLDKPVSETFTIAAGNPANVVSPGVVGTELENTCTVPPASQDTDGHVTVLKGEAERRPARVRDEVGRHQRRHRRLPVRRRLRAARRRTRRRRPTRPARSRRARRTSSPRCTPGRPWTTR